MARVIAPFLDDFKIRVVDFAGMNDDKLSIFPNDIRIIAEYFRCKRLKTEYKPSRIKIVHKRELCYFMEYVVGDSRFAYDFIMQDYGKEPEYMCEILDRIEEKGRQRGVGQGIEIGRLQIQKENAADLHKRGWSDEEIADFLKVDVVDVRIWLDSGEN